MVFENQFYSKLDLQQLFHFDPLWLCGQTHAVPSGTRDVPTTGSSWTTWLDNYLAYQRLVRAVLGPARPLQAQQIWWHSSESRTSDRFWFMFSTSNDLQIQISGVLVVARYFGYYSQQLEEETKMNQRFMEKLEEVQEMQRRQQELWELGAICAGGVRSGSPGAKQTGLMCQPVNCSSIDEKFGEDARTSKVQERRNAQEDIWAMNNNLVALVI